MNRLQFNTGRKYTAQGQRIVAVLHDDGVVSFNDHDRMIWGEFKLPLHCRLSQTEVMHWYDSGQYQMSARVKRSTHDWIE